MTIIDATRETAHRIMTKRKYIPTQQEIDAVNITVNDKLNCEKVCSVRIKLRYFGNVIEYDC